MITIDTMKHHIYNEDYCFIKKDLTDAEVKYLFDATGWIVYQDRVYNIYDLYLQGIFEKDLYNQIIEYTNQSIFNRYVL